MSEPGYTVHRALICVADDMETELIVQELDALVLMNLLCTDRDTKQSELEHRNECMNE